MLTRWRSPRAENLAEDGDVDVEIIHNEDARVLCDIGDGSTAWGTAAFAAAPSTGAYEHFPSHAVARRLKTGANELLIFGGEIPCVTRLRRSGSRSAGARKHYNPSSLILPLGADIDEYH